jgi:hypothetical protein
MKSFFHSRTLATQLSLGVSSQSSSTAVSRDSLNYHSAGLGSSLYSLGSDPTENTVCIVIAQQYLDCCLLIRCSGNLFTESLHSNERLLWISYSGFQASCHSIKIANKPFGVRMKLKYLEVTVRNQNYIHEITSGLNSGNACFHPVQYFCLLVSRLWI